MADDRPAAEADLDAVRLYAFRVWSYKQGEAVALMIHLGDRLGLYRAMAGRGPMTPADVAAATGLHERWVLEWLRGQAAAGLVESGDGAVFRLPDAGGPVLADESSSVWFAAGAFAGSAVPDGVAQRLAESFRTGVGLSYDDLGPSGAHNVERMLGPWTRLALVPVVLPALDSVVAKLGAGAKVADVGCGAGLALLAMAEAFPESRFYGFDPSVHALGRAEANRAAAGLDNVELSCSDASALGDAGPFDLVLTLDCLHDMTRPFDAARAIHGGLDPDGTWLIKEIRSGETWEDNQRNPLLAMLYATSVTTCMSSAMSEPGGAGLGTLGLPPARAEELCRAAGFTRFVVHDFDDPANLYFEVRP